jgi:hypothetical protein
VQCLDGAEREAAPQLARRFIADIRAALDG